MAMTDLDSATILPQWTRLAEESLEAGQVPLLVLGAGPLSLDALPGLLALPGMDEVRTGLAHPAALAGGDAGLWFLTMLHRLRMAHTHAGGDAALRVRAIQERVPPALFTGADVATHAAVLNLAAQTLLASPLGRRTTTADESVPLGLAWQIFPAHHAGSMNRWDWLPFETSAPAHALIVPDHPDSAAPLAAWTAYAGLLIALAMVLAALIF